MAATSETIRSQALTPGLSNTRNKLDILLHAAEQKDITHMEFLEYLLNEEISRKSKLRLNRIYASAVVIPMLITILIFALIFLTYLVSPRACSHSDTSVGAPCSSCS